MRPFCVVVARYFSPSTPIWDVNKVLRVLEGNMLCSSPQIIMGKTGRQQPAHQSCRGTPPSAVLFQGLICTIRPSLDKSVWMIWQVSDRKEKPISPARTKPRGLRKLGRFAERSMNQELLHREEGQWKPKLTVRQSDWLVLLAYISHAGVFVTQVHRPSQYLVS